MRSIKQNFPEINQAEIIWKFTNDEFKNGYKKLIQKWVKDQRLYLSFYNENESDLSFNDLVLSTSIIYNDNPYTICFSDDCIVIREVPSMLFTLLDACFNGVESLAFPISGFSLKMGYNITYGYAQDQMLNKPKLICKRLNEEELIYWRWTNIDPRNDWGYPGSLISTIRKTSWQLYYLQTYKYAKPNWIETVMNQNRDYNLPYMAAFAVPRIINTNINIVQDVCNNRHGYDPEHTVEILNTQFLAGKQIRLEPLLDLKLNCQETDDIQIEWEQR